MFSRKEVLTNKGVPGLLVPVDNLVQSSIYKIAPRLSKYDYVSPRGQLRGFLGSSVRETYVRYGEERIPKGSRFLQVRFVPSYFTADNKHAIQQVLLRGLGEYLHLLGQLDENPKFEEVEYVGDSTHARFAKLATKRLGYVDYWLDPWIDWQRSRADHHIFTKKEDIIKTRDQVLALQSRVTSLITP